MSENRKLWRKHAEEVAAIVSVASAETTEEYFRRAKEAAHKLTPEQLTNLPRYFHDNRPSIPPDQEKRFAGKNVAWMVAIQKAIFHIYYFCSDVSLPILKEIAFGEYDWTQVYALYTLCAIANDGIERDQIIEEIVDEMPEFWDMALFPTIDFISSIGHPHPKLVQRLEEFIQEWLAEDGLVDSMIFIGGLIRIDKDRAKKYQSALRDLMNGKELEYESPEYARVHQIGAAMWLKELFPDDEDVHMKLQDWQTNRPEEYEKAITEWSRDVNVFEPIPPDQK